MPAHFCPPECVVITDKSSVAAGGIAVVSYTVQSRRAQDGDRLCGSIILSIQDSVLMSFDIRIPDVATWNLRSIPCILLSGLSSPPEAGRGFGFQGTL